MVSVADKGRRAHPRTSLKDGVAYLSAHRLLIARLGDVSANGAFLSTAYPDPVGTRATLELPLDGEAVELDVEVVRVGFDRTSGAGMGVSFLDVPRALRRRLMAEYA